MSAKFSCQGVTHLSVVCKLAGVAHFWYMPFVKARQQCREAIKEQLKRTNIMNIKPLADRVLVLPAQAEEKVGGIIIPDTAKEKPQHGTIVAAGQGTKDEAMVLKEGDEILYGKYSGTELEFEGTKYLIMRQSDVLAVVNK